MFSLLTKTPMAALDNLTSLWHQYDATVSKLVFQGLAAAGCSEVKQGPSPITRDLPFVRSPTTIVTAIAVYLTIVLLGTLRIKARGAAKQDVEDPAWLKALVQVICEVPLAIHN
jgi:hypothetical protein